MSKKHFKRVCERNSIIAEKKGKPICRTVRDEYGKVKLDPVTNQPMTEDVQLYDLYRKR